MEPKAFAKKMRRQLGKPAGSKRPSNQINDEDKEPVVHDNQAEQQAGDDEIRLHQAQEAKKAARAQKILRERAEMLTKEIEADKKSRQNSAKLRSLNKTHDKKIAVSTIDETIYLPGDL